MEPWAGEEESGRSLGQTPSSFREFPVYKEGLGLWNPQTQDIIKRPCTRRKLQGPGRSRHFIERLVRSTAWEDDTVIPA